MSNPFDQFATELNSALPPGAAPPAQEANPFSFEPPAPAPAPSNKPVMNVPPMANGYGQPQMGQQQQMGQQPMYGGMGGMDQGMQQQQQFGAPQGQGAPMGGMGGPPPAQDMSSMGGAPPPAGGDPFAYGAAAPAAPQGQPDAGFGAPPVPPAAGMGADPYASAGTQPTAAPAAGDPFGAPQQQPPQMAPPAAPPTPNPYGAPAAPPQQAPPSNDPFAAYGAPAPANDAYGAPQQAPPTPNPYGAPAAQAPPTPSGYGAPAAVPPGQQAPPTPNAYGGAPPAAPQAAPPANDAFGGYGAPPPAAPAASDPFGGYGAQPGAPPAAPAASDPFGGYGAPPAPTPAAPPANDAFGGYGAQPPAAPPANDAFGGYGAQPPADPSMGALVVSQQQSNPYGMPPQQQAPPQGMPQQQAPPQGMPPQQPPAAADPFSVFNEAPAPPPAQPAGPPPGALVPAQAPGALVPAQAPPPQQQPAAPADDGDVWSDLGFGAAPSGGAPAGDQPAQEEKKDSGDLPPGGEFYDARIFTPTLGVMFFKPQELTDSLFLNTDRSIVDGLAERPVVAFIVEGSSARSAGVELGHVLLKVNGVDVKNPKEASRLIKEGPRPLPLLFYVPSTEVVVAEGEHMVKYDTRETTAPNSAKDWKPKYVVIGGIIAQPWMINMYRSKSEYDIAVIETQARRPVSVKVKQFSLQGARIQNDWQGPQMVKYKNKLHPWKYIVVLPVARNPIKISSPNLAQLKPTHEGIRRVLLAQQRDRGGNPHSAAPRGGQGGYSRPQSHSDPYGSRPTQQAPPQQHHHSPQPQYGQQQQQQQQQHYAQQNQYGGY